MGQKLPDNPTAEQLERIAAADKAADEAKIAAIVRQAEAAGIEVVKVKPSSSRVHSQYGTNQDPKLIKII